MVASALELVTPRARALGVVPQVALPDAPVRVMAGAVRMEQVLVNLTLNALDAVEGRAGAVVALELSARDGLAVMQVRDTGRGIAPPDLARVGEPFFTTRTTEGLGLGLAICKAIVAEFGGDLGIVSTEGQGTTVTVTLPLAEAAQEAAE